METGNNAVTLIKSEVSNCASLYSDYVRAVNARLKAAIDSPNALIAVKRDLSKDLNLDFFRWDQRMTQTIKSSIDGIRAEITAQTISLSQTMNHSSESFRSVRELSDEIESNVAKAFKEKMANDLREASSSYKKHVMSVMQDVARGVDESHARVSDRERRIEATALDKIGRKWAPDRWATMSLNKAYFDLYNTSIVFLLSCAGETHAQIVRPGHSSDGGIFDLQDYPAVEKTLLHPNSGAIVARIVTK